MTRRQIIALASRGAKFLDRIHPSWYKEINISQLDLSDGTCCIIGQLNGGDYSPEMYLESQIREGITATVEQRLRTEAKKINIPGFKSCEIGFDLDDCVERAVAKGMEGFDENTHGFNLPCGDDTSENFSILTEVWVGLIRARRAKRT